MRVIAGILGGRNFDSPQSHRTHPMSDKIRGALFNALGDIDSLTVLDAYAGSGAVGIEALSRGAASVIFIDNDKRAQDVIQKNIASLNLTGRAKLIQAGAVSWSKQNKERLFDIVILDPPYDDIHLNTVYQMAGHTIVGGILVLSWPMTQAIPTFADYEQVLHKVYGDAQLVFYRRLKA